MAQNCANMTRIYDGIKTVRIFWRWAAMSREKRRRISSRTIASCFCDGGRGAARRAPVELPGERNSSAMAAVGAKSMRETAAATRRAEKTHQWWRDAPLSNTHDRATFHLLVIACSHLSACSDSNKTRPRPPSSGLEALRRQQQRWWRSLRCLVSRPLTIALGVVYKSSYLLIYLRARKKVMG